MDYGPQAATALRLLEKYGATGVLIRKESGGRLAADGSAIISDNRADVKLVQMAAGQKDGLSNSAGNTLSDNVRARQTTFLLAGLEEEPAAGNCIEFNGRTFNVVDVRTVNPNGALNIVHFCAAVLP